MDTRYLLVVAVIIVIGWFAFGVIFNLRRGEAFLRWLQKGLPLVGERTTFRWLGSSVAEMVIAKPQKPFRRLEILVVLAPRDVPWLWLLAAAQGRRDTLVFRADLLHIPPLDFELADPAAWTGRLAIAQATNRGWESQSYHELQLLFPPGQSARALSCLADLAGPLDALAPHYYRLGLRRDLPNLEVHMALPGQDASAEALIAGLQDVARGASAQA